MSPRFQLGLLALAPVVLMGGLYGLGVSIPVPHFGRDYVIRLRLPDPGAMIGLPEVQGPADAARPLVVIDAGHGGHDPGASGAGFVEKQLVLGLARALRDQLLAQGGVRVAMTRDADRFLVLRERAEIARRLGADLFLSIHADSAADAAGGDTVAGATIYTLSGEASDAAAARVAARENQADAINGVVLDGTSDAVNAILVDLSQRLVNEDAAGFAELIVREGDGRLNFHPAPRRSAAFAVLKAPDVPSVLFEAGYISNPQDAARLASRQGRSDFAEVLARAIRIHFARESASRPGGL